MKTDFLNSNKYKLTAKMADRLDTIRIARLLGFEYVDIKDITVHKVSVIAGFITLHYNYEGNTYEFIYDQILNRYYYSDKADPEEDYYSDKPYPDPEDDDY